MLTNALQRPSRIFQPLAVLLTMIFSLGVPFWVIIVTAGKSAVEARQPNLALPSQWEFGKNISTTFSEGNMGVASLGSLLLLIPSVFGVLLLGAMASWVLARRKTRGLSIAYTIGISGVIVPPAIVPIVLLLKQIGLQGTPLGLIGVYIGMYMSTVIFFITGFIRTIPIELEEAARVDGANPMRVFFRIIFPLLGPVVATATILVSLFIWNDVFYALFVVGGRLDTLPLNLYQVASSGLYLQNWNLIFSYILLMTLPMLLVFIFAQRRIISGVTSGAVK
ncbi:MAG: carbohydrate ABC transporter permease [Actinobacteria bacterium]|jgi:raffinose/stachyose/melibiose transport system permease protein|nr:carbohydrate ABC transporter permease [Actinomycetota bacterium]